MRCPFCEEQETKVIDSRLIAEGDQVRRRRECQCCYERFTTFETAELVLPKIIKSDGTRENFSERKLRDGMQRALEKRPVSVEGIEASLHRIQASLRAKGEREVSSRLIGEYVMDELKSLDEVAYVRFASVYRSFKDLSDFQEMIATIQKSAHLKPEYQEPGCQASEYLKSERPKSGTLASEQRLRHAVEANPASAMTTSFSIDQDELTPGS